MRKINLCYFLFVGVLVSCTNTYDVCEMQRNETEDMSSRMAGDGVYDVLGFGYDITEDYLGETRHGAGEYMPYSPCYYLFFFNFWEWMSELLH